MACDWGMRLASLPRRSAVCAALAAVCWAPARPGRALEGVNLPSPSLPSPLLELARQIEEERAEDERLRSEALRPNRYGKLTEEPERAPLKYEAPGYNGQRGVASFTGRLAPEYEGDTRVRYSNPYAKRLGDVASQRPELIAPGTPSMPVYRDGYLSVKPNNLQCDADKRNCKFSGAMPGTVSALPAYKPTPPPYEETADYRRAQLKEQNRIIREANLAKQAAREAERAAQPATSVAAAE